MIYLEDYIDTVEALPSNLQRLLTTLHELEAKVAHRHAALVTDMDRFSAAVAAGTLTAPDRARALAVIQRRMTECHRHDEERALAAMAAREVVNTHIARANDNYVAFCAELHAEETKLEKRNAQAAGGASSGAGGSSAAAASAVVVPHPAQTRGYVDTGVYDRRDGSPDKKRAKRDESSANAATALAAAAADASSRRVGAAKPSQSSTTALPSGGRGTSRGGASSASTRPSAQIVQQPSSGRASRRGATGGTVSSGNGANGGAMSAHEDTPEPEATDGGASSSSSSSRRRGAASTRSASATQVTVVVGPRGANVRDSAPAQGGNGIGSGDGTGGQDSMGDPMDVDGDGSAGVVGADTTVGEEGEEVFCFCRRPAFGDMLGCDNEECEFEWFHLECLGLKSPPPEDLESWYCPACTEAQRAEKKRKSRGGR